MRLGKLRFAIVGIGYWGPNYARIINNNIESELVWCCDTNLESLLRMKALYPFIKITQNLQDILDDVSVDCVAIVTPPQTHYLIAKQCLEAGKHLLVEKPFTMTSVESSNLINIAKMKKRCIGIDHTFIYNPALELLKRNIDSGSLGKIYYIYGMYNALGPIRKDVSAMWDLSPHFIYSVNYLLGVLPMSVSANGGDYLRDGSEDVVFLNFRYPDNVIFNLHSSWLDPLKVRQLIVVGSKKMAIFDDVSPDSKLRIFNKSASVQNDPDFADLRVILRVGDVVIPKIKDKEPLNELISDFIKSVLRKRHLKIQPKDGYEVVRILEVAQRSLVKSGKMININYEKDTIS